MITRAAAITLDTLGALWVLATLAWRSRGRLWSPYWRWRLQTAYPSGRHPGGWGPQARSVLEYARWAWRIRRLR